MANISWLPEPGGVQGKTDDLAAALASWRTDEFKRNFGVGAIRSEYAYVRGITGKDITLGVFDNGTWKKHSEFNKPGKLETLTTTGIRAYTDPYVLVRKLNGNKGDPFVLDGGNSVPWAARSIYHGTGVAGLVGALRNSSGMHGVAFDANLVAANNGDPGPEDGIVEGNDENMYKAGFEALANAGVRGIVNSWGIGYDEKIDGVTLPAPLYKVGSKPYKLADGVSQYLSNPTHGTYDATANVAKAGIIQVFATGNDKHSAPESIPGLPYFRPDIEDGWINAVALMDSTLPASYSNYCDFTKWYCVSAPGHLTTTASFTGEGDSKVESYLDFTGTSAAAPMVLGALGLVMQRFPYLTNSQARAVLLTTSRHLGKSAQGVPDNIYGWGIVDIEKAMDGPGQFIGRFDASLPESYNGANEEVWGNDISETALVQRKIEDTAEHVTWEALKKTRKWESGVPATASTSDKAEYAFRKARDEAYLARQYFGSLAKSGLGTLRLKGKNTYTGDTLINGGLLAVDGSLTSKVLVNNTGMVGGNGTLGSLVTNAGGIVSPGNSVGKLTVTGDATFDKGSLFDVEIKADQSVADQLDVKGKVTLLGGVVQVRLEDDKALMTKAQVESLFHKSYDILLAGKGHTGAFDGVSPEYSYITGSLNYKDSSKVSLGFELTAEGAIIESLKADLLAAQKEIERLQAEKLAAETLAAEKIEAERLAKEAADKKAADDKPVADKLAEDDKPVADRLAAEEAEKQATLKAEQLATAKLEAERLEIEILKESVKNLVMENADKAPHNQKAVFGAVKLLGYGNPLANTVLLKQRSEILNYDGLSGEIHATLSGVLIEDSHFISDAATDRIRAAFDGVAVKAQPTIDPLAYGPGGKAKGGEAAGEAIVAVTPAPASMALWGQAYGAWSHADSDGNASGFSRNTGGFVTGLDGVVADDWRFGVLAGYGKTSLHSGGGKASVDNYQIGLYGGAKWDALGLRFGANLAKHEIDTKRTASFGDLSNEHETSYDAKTVQVFGELGYEIKTAFAEFEPFAAASHVHLKTDAFQEDGGISNLLGQSSTSDVTMTTLGLRVSRDVALSDTMSLTARGTLGWNHAFGDVTSQSRLAFAGGQSFAIVGLPIAGDLLAVEAGFDVGIGANTSIGIGYTGQFSKSANDNAVKADLTVRF